MKSKEERIREFKEKVKKFGVVPTVLSTKTAELEEMMPSPPKAEFERLRNEIVRSLKENKELRDAEPEAVVSALFVTAISMSILMGMSQKDVIEMLEATSFILGGGGESGGEAA